MSESVISNSSTHAKNKKGRLNNRKNNGSSSSNQTEADEFSSCSAVLYRFVDALEINALPLSMTLDSAGWVGRHSYVPCPLPPATSHGYGNDGSGSVSSSYHSPSNGTPRNCDVLAARSFAQSLLVEHADAEFNPSSSSSSSWLEVEEIRFLEVVSRAFDVNHHSNRSGDDDEDDATGSDEGEEDEDEEEEEKAKQIGQTQKACTLDCAALLLASGALSMLLPGEHLNALATVVRFCCLSLSVPLNLFLNLQRKTILLSLVQHFL